MRPLAIDLCTGLHGWSEGLVAEGWRVRGYDIEDMCAVLGEPRPEHIELVLKSILDLHGSELADADLIVASPPCQEFSYMAMPWGRAKQIARALRGEGDFPEGYKGSRTLAELTALFDACFRLQRECNEARAALGLPPIPMVVENVKGAEPWAGPAARVFGSFYLWGDVPALMPNAIRARKNPGFRFDGSGRSFQTESVKNHVEGVKVASESGRRTDKGNGARFTSRDCGLEAVDAAQEGRKQKGSGREWFAGEGTIGRTTSSKSPARKAASAKIAKIPEALSRHIARVYFPKDAARSVA